MRQIWRSKRWWFFFLWIFEVKSRPTHLPMSRVFHNRSFILTLILKINTCVMTLLVLARSKLNSNLIKIVVPYKLPMGSWSSIGTSTIDYVAWWVYPSIASTIKIDHICTHRVAIVKQRECQVLDSKLKFKCYERSKWRLSFSLSDHL